MGDIRPKVSVIIPVYNAVKYIRKAIESVQNQSLRDIEIIVGDGGSTDGSLDVLQEYAGDDKRILLISKAGSGYGQSVNDCIRAAHGRYIGIVEADDFIDPQMYETLYAEAERSGAQIVKSDFYCFIETERGLIRRWRVPVAVAKGFYNRMIKPSAELKVFRCCMNTWCGIYDRGFLIKNHIEHHESPGGSYQDNGFWFQSFALAERVLFVQQAFYHYRQDNPAASVQNTGKVFDVCDEYDFIYRRLTEHPNVFDYVEGAFWVARLGAYEFALHRIAPEHRPDFIRRMKSDFSPIYPISAALANVFSGRERKLLETLYTSSNDGWVNKRRNALSKGYWCMVEHGVGYTLSRIHWRRAQAKLTEKNN